ncbi:hypothetical protein CF326_g7337 [Tilletia indica]|nr:hypothetical protein CF326_g7337 [Tilletia indica]
MRPDSLATPPPEENAPAPALQGPHAYQNTAEAYSISGVLAYDKDTNMIKTQFDPTMVHMSDFTDPVYAQAAKNRLVAKKGSADRRRGEEAMMARAVKKMEIAEKKKAEAEAAAGGASTSASSSAVPLDSTPTATVQKKRVIPKKAPPKKPSGKGKAKAKAPSSNSGK